MNKRGKEVDTTFLSLDIATERGFVHRDYIAHCLRWSHVIKELGRSKTYADAVVVDAGCGRELPLAKTMYSSRFIPKMFHAVDYGPIPEKSRALFHTGKFPIQFHERTDFAEWADKPEQAGIANVLVNFECLEHVEPLHVLRMLAGFKKVLRPDGVAYVSTPCWDVVSCADNHVNEMRYEVLGAVFEENGWTIRNVFGTFASISDYEPHLSDAHRQTFKDLRCYYDVNYLATIFAPFYPQYSRNCLWEILPVQVEEGKRRFRPLAEATRPWTSSDKWRDFNLEAAELPGPWDPTVGAAETSSEALA